MKCIAPLQTLLQGEFKSPAEQAGATESTRMAYAVRGRRCWALAAEADPLAVWPLQGNISLQDQMEVGPAPQAETNIT